MQDTKKIARKSYAVLINSKPLDPNHEFIIRSLNLANVNNKLSLTNRKSIKMIRLVLKHMVNIEELWCFGEYFSSLVW
ncbi:MAG: hypothetical protein ACFFHD_04190 [Promethearchaeota archaeon]